MALAPNDIMDINLFGLYYHLADCGHYNCEKLDFGSYITGSPVKFLNKIFALQYLVSEPNIEKLTQLIETGKAPNNIMFNNKKVALSFENIILNKQYSQIVAWPGMLKVLHSQLPNITDNLVSIEVVNDYKSLEKWQTIIEYGLYNGQKQDISFFLNLINSANIKLFMAYYKDEPATVIMSYINDDTLGLYMLATLYEYRRLGLARAIMTYIINNAYSEGLKYAILQATEAGYALYKELGFEEYCQYKVFEYKP